MKKFLLSVLFIAGAMTASAQLVVGGSLDLNVNGSSKTKFDDLNTGRTPSRFSLLVNGKIGYLLNEKVEIGGALGIGGGTTTTYYVASPASDGKSHKDTRSSSFSWSINPYTRYRLFEVKGFGMWLEGVVGLGMDHAIADKVYVVVADNYRSAAAASATNTSAKDNLKKNPINWFNWSIVARPVITYNINEHWRVEASLNAIGLGLSGTVRTATTHDAADVKHKTRTSNTDFGLDVTTRGTTVALGVAYKF